MEGEITPPASSTSVTATPSSCCSFESFFGVGESPSSSGGISDHWLEVQRQQIQRKLQGSVNRYNDCFRSLQLALADLDLLRLENLELRSEHLELSLLVEEMEKTVLAPIIEDGGGGGGGGALGARSAFRSSGSGSPVKKSVAAGKENLPPAGDNDTGDGKVGTLGGVPKSISIRSSGFLAVKNPAGCGGGLAEGVGGSSGEGKRPHRLLVPASVQVGEEEDGKAIEVEVYNQGTRKTELCNKWQEMGWCPYGEKCQFAHGVQELRPVIRHPRYKTQLCRMVLGGGGCPYGHRCHYRHALPQQNR